jgi:hypothetical protein
MSPRNIDESPSNPLKDKPSAHKGVASLHDIGSHKRAAWSYVNALDVTESATGVLRTR